MKRIITTLFSGLCAIALLFNYSCQKSSPTTKSNGPDSVLINIGNNIIMPSYNNLAASVNSLDSAITVFKSNPDNNGLANVQLRFKNAYLAWMTVSEYNGFGPASVHQPVLSGLNLFPATTAKIDTNIRKADFNVNTLGNADVKGFPALDYLLFGGGTNALVNYTTDANAVNRKQYLAAVSADIKTEVNDVVKAWSPTGGNYLNTFVTGTGNSVSSSLGLLINSMDHDFEILKNDCLGIPLGKQPPGAPLQILPKEVEAYYSGISVQLAVTQMKAVQAIYLGTNAIGPSLGLDNYVTKANAQYNGGPLSTTIKTDFAQTIAGLQAIPDPLSATIQNNPAPADAVYSQCQKLVVLLKTDMPSSLGVLITYGDNDGD